MILNPAQAEALYKAIQALNEGAASYLTLPLTHSSSVRQSLMFAPTLMIASNCDLPAM